jgi:hypothetical protein
MARHCMQGHRASLAVLLAMIGATACSPEADQDSAAATAAPAAPAPVVAPPAPSPEPARSFASFEFVDSSGPESATFVFSAGPATSASPIVITAKDRALSPADRDRRTHLQREWLEVNVPDHFEFGERALVECGPVAGGAVHACDQYTFNDSRSGQVHDYFIYVGNWPAGD